MNRTRIYTAVVLLACTNGTFAGEQEAVIAELRSQIEVLTKRLDAIEAANGQTELKVKEVRKNAGAAAWAETVKFSGDFRYRYEYINDQRRPGNRERNRLRSRAVLTAQPHERIKLGLGLASGSSDPLSTNQSLGNAATTKDLNLDLAYFDWRLTDHVRLIGGKMKNPFHRPEKHSLIWDGDLTPEGLHVKYDNGSLFAGVGLSFLESDSGSSGTGDTGNIYGVQVGYRAELENSRKLVFGASYYHLPLQGKTSFLDGECGPGDGNCFGNTLNPDGTFANDFNEIEAFAELHLTVGKHPLVLFGDIVQNQDADTEDTGFALGMRLGKASGPGSWQLSYTYQDLEADATFGTVSDSDIGGGGTDNQGHLFKAAYALNKRTQLKATYFLNQYGEFTRGRKLDYDRLQLDLSFKY